MFERKIKTIFVVLFLVMLVVPLMNTNLKKNQISEAENRVLAQFPDIYKDDGQFNKNFNDQFEHWVNDNIGFRSNMVSTNAKIQYYVFNVLENNGNTFLGPKGEFNYATASILCDYQHLNLYSEYDLKYKSEGLQIINL